MVGDVSCQAFASELVELSAAFPPTTKGVDDSGSGVLAIRELVASLLDDGDISVASYTVGCLAADGFSGC